MHAHTQSFIRYTIAGRYGAATVMELLQPLDDTPILFDATGDIVRIEGAILDVSSTHGSPAPNAG